MKLRACALTLAAFLLLSLTAPAARGAEEGFTPVRVYEAQFEDVAPDAWYASAVQSLYELGLINGKDVPERFAPEDNITVGEILTLAARLRSLYETGSSEAGRDAYGGDGGAWYLPYTAYLQSMEIIGPEFEGSYERPASRAEMAHVLANTLPQDYFAPINREVVELARASGAFIQDVDSSTPYESDIILLYDWGILSGADETGSFLPDQPISRCEAAAMAARLAYSQLRLTLEWEILPAYSKKGTAMQDLVYSDGTFYEAPNLSDPEQIDADIRFMLSRGEREITLNYPANTLTNQSIDRLLSVFLDTVRNYVEQTYNNIFVSFALRTGYVQLTFSSSLYDEARTDYYRDATMDYAIAVHDAMWESGQITADMSEYDKAKVYFAWICDNCRYDHTYADMSHSGFRLFDEGIAVCDGYTSAYNLLLKLEGISCGTWSAADHIWTTAVLDGTSCHIDTTWGDQDYGIDYRYFAMTEAEAVARF